jgi:hypothetical protein
MSPQVTLRRIKQPQRRRGAVSIWAMVCLVFVTAISASLGRVALLGSRQMVQERRYSQAEWLAQSGWSLAMAQLTRNSDYTGETWDVSAADLGGADAGRVKIEVTPSETSTETRQVQVVAGFPVESDRRTQVSRRGTWQKPKL